MTRQPPSQVETTSVALVPGLTILWHPEVDRVGERAALLELASGTVEVSRTAPLFSQPRSSVRRPLADPFISRQPFTLSFGREGWTVECCDCRLNVEVDGAPLRQRVQLDGAMEPVLVLGGRVALVLHWLDPTPARKPKAFSLVGESAKMLRLAEDVAAIADLGDPVLIRGETGSGKELLAESLHRASGRPGRHVAANMAAIPRQLAASELFGAVRGAFTGADRFRKGLCQSARRGTLFLDEIGDAPAEVQVALLRAIESGRARAVGDEVERAIDVRWVAATDADLEGAVARGDFRAQLLHRLESFVLHLPPLRDRRDDIGRLFLHFLEIELERFGELCRLQSAEPWVPASLLAKLAMQPWPGNVRQLRNVTRQLVVANRGSEDFRVPGAVGKLWRSVSEPGKEPTTESMRSKQSARKHRSIRNLDDEAIRQALTASCFEIKATAAALGVSRSALYRRLETMPGIRRAADLDDGVVRHALARHDGNVEAAALDLRVSRAALVRRLARTLG